MVRPDDRAEYAPCLKLISPPTWPRTRPLPTQQADGTGNEANRAKPQRRMEEESSCDFSSNMKTVVGMYIVQHASTERWSSIEDRILVAPLQVGRYSTSFSATTKLLLFPIMMRMAGVDFLAWLYKHSIVEIAVLKGRVARDGSGFFRMHCSRPTEPELFFKFFFDSADLIQIFLAVNAKHRRINYVCPPLLANSLAALYFLCRLLALCGVPLAGDSYW